MMQTDQSPSREAVALRDCPPGPFLFNGHLGFKTEYGACRVDENGANMPGSKVRWVVTHWPEAYVMSSGEAFWGGTKADEERAALMVTPVDADAILALLTPAPPQPATADAKGEPQEALVRHVAEAIDACGNDARAGWDWWQNEARAAIEAVSQFERDHLTPAMQPGADREAKAREVLAGIVNGQLYPDGRPQFWAVHTSQAIRAMIAFADATRPQVSDEREALLRIAEGVPQTLNDGTIRQVLMQAQAAQQIAIAALRTQPSQPSPDAHGLREAHRFAATVEKELVDRAPSYSIASIEREHFDRAILAINGLLRAALAAPHPIARADDGEGE